MITTATGEFSRVQNVNLLDIVFLNMNFVSQSLLRHNETIVGIVFVFSSDVCAFLKFSLYYFEVTLSLSESNELSG
jgi:hypothetical protein